MARPREGESWRVAPERGFPIKVDDIASQREAFGAVIQPIGSLSEGAGWPLGQTEGVPQGQTVQLRGALERIGRLSTSTQALPPGCRFCAPPFNPFVRSPVDRGGILRANDHTGLPSFQAVNPRFHSTASSSTLRGRSSLLRTSYLAINASKIS